MKDKILVFIIGLLIGAVVTASGFLVYEKNNKNTTQTQNQTQTQGQIMERPNGQTPPEMPDGQTPPEKPDGENSNESRPEPPSKNNTSNTNKTN